MNKTTLNPLENARRKNGSTAKDVTFDNTLTELVSSNVQNAIEEVADDAHHAINALTLPSGTIIYMDEHNGQIGYNTDESRGIATFHPFA